MSTAVCIVSYNTCDLLRGCLESVLKERPDEVIVVDNASSDASVAMVRSEFPSVSLLELNHNVGYGAAVNRAVTCCHSPHLLVLNSDTLPKPGSLQALSAYLDNNPDVAIAGPRLLNSDGTLQRSTFPFPTPMDVFLDVSNLGRLASILPGLCNRYLRTWLHDRVRSVPSLLGAALAIRREAFEQVKGFDETFYMYYEEVDLCYRLQQIGWKIHFVPDTSVVHIGGASTKQRQTEMAVQIYLSLAHFYQLHYTRGRTLQLVALVKLIALGRLIRDSISVHLIRDASRRNHLDKNIAAWQCLLFTRWERGVSYQ